jgi:hypothetical protein
VLVVAHDTDFSHLPLPFVTDLPHLLLEVGDEIGELLLVEGARGVDVELKEELGVG